MSLVTPTPSDEKQGRKEHFTRKEAVRYLGSIGCPISLRTLENMATDSTRAKGPPFTKFSWGAVRYSRGDLDKWAAANTRRVE